MSKKEFLITKKACLVFFIIIMTGTVLNIIPDLYTFVTATINMLTIISLIFLIIVASRIKMPTPQDIDALQKGEKSVSELKKAYPIKVVNQEECENIFFKNQSKEIEDYYRISIANNPNDKEKWEKLCYVLMIKRNFDELENIASDGLNKFKNDPKLLGFLAQAYEQSDEKERVDELKRNHELSEFTELVFYNISHDLKAVKKLMKLKLKTQFYFLNLKNLSYSFVSL